MKNFVTFGVLALATQALAAPSNNKHTHSHPKKSSIGRSVSEPKYFTSAVSTRAVNTTIITNAGDSVPGQAGAYGHFSFRINSDKEIICYDLRTVGVTGEYMSPAFTATHIHEAQAGAAGPPRIAFPNPTFVRKDVTGAEIRESKGCLQGPFRTNVTVGGVDSGSASGFTLLEIENDPSSFFSDTHTREFVAGAIRGQLIPSELEVKRPRSFTDVLSTTATPDQVVNANNEKVQGLEGAKGFYTLRLNTNTETICYDITLIGFNGQEYFSPAKTSTHTHAAAAGVSGPPRLAYKNPQRKRLWWGGKSKARYSSACIKGPFTTGLLANGVDTGSASGFTLQQLADNPTSFFSDVHTESRQAGAVRGQMVRT